MTGAPDTLQLLAARMAQVVASPYSDFYRTLYNVPAGSTPDLASWDDWSLVPTFTKEVMLERPMREYTFVPNKKVDSVYYTSGTSGKPPAFCPRVAYAGGFNYRKAFYAFPGAFMNSLKTQHRTDRFLHDMGSRSKALVFDGKNPAASILLAKAAGVDALGVHTFTVWTIGEEMKKAGMNQHIRLLEFVGETCSLALYSYMRETFPNATIISFYGLSEAEGAVGYTCRALSDSEPYPVYHAHPEFRLDVIDPVTEKALPLEAGVEGELLITDLAERAFPLVRYRPGDTVRIVDASCAEHGEWTFTVLGKTASDFMLVPGGQLRADEIERVLRTMPAEVTDIFEMHRYDGGTPQKPMLEVILHVQPHNPHADLNALAQRIQQELRVAPNRTYQQGVDEGRYLPLTCVSLAQTTPQQKHRRMFKH